MTLETALGYVRLGWARTMTRAGHPELTGSAMPVETAQLFGLSPYYLRMYGRRIARRTLGL